jgi:hypothetical protein
MGAYLADTGMTTMRDGTHKVHPKFENGASLENSTTLCNNGSGPKIWLPGRISTGF